MGLRSAIQSATNSAFNALGDIPTSVTYTQVSAGGYNATTGATTETTLELTLTALITKYEQENINAGLAQTTDRQMLIPGKDLSITPKPQDRVNFDSRDYEVYKVERDPVTALYKLHIRER
tara:strand:+ start:263 stop:625 length:363 start_codon:yes stop_codon:yes gene_type:complete